MIHQDTIAAIATGIGGAISILRISGPQALSIAHQVWRGKKLSYKNRRKMLLGHLIFPSTGKEKGQLIDYGLAVYFPAPHSYTGEDVIEFHLHGGIMIAQLALKALLSLGVRLAEPGEFTRRAFLNGKLDLTQAEAVQDMIQAHSERALRLAQRQLEGILGKNIQQFYDDIYILRAEIEAHLDFPDENLDLLPPDVLIARLTDLLTRIKKILDTYQVGLLFREGIRITICGPPNVGKSSLLNQIVGQDRAIVTHIPGTTRDTLEAFVHIGSLPVCMIDTAGIRETNDPIEQEGIRRSLKSIENADLVLFVCDSSNDRDWNLWSTLPIPHHRRIIVVNKIDLCPYPSWLSQLPPPIVRISAQTKEGFSELFQIIEEKLGVNQFQDTEISINTRHQKLLFTTVDMIEQAMENLQEGQFELASMFLQHAQDALGQILGKTVTPDLLDHIFSRFCIGK